MAPLTENPYHNISGGTITAKSSNYSDTITNTVFGLCAIFIGGLTVWQGRRVWRLWYLGRVVTGGTRIFHHLLQGTHPLTVVSTKDQHHYPLTSLNSQPADPQAISANEDIATLSPADDTLTNTSTIYHLHQGLDEGAREPRHVDRGFASPSHGTTSASKACFDDPDCVLDHAGKPILCKPVSDTPPFKQRLHLAATTSSNSTRVGLARRYSAPSTLKTRSSSGALPTTADHGRPWE